MTSTATLYSMPGTHISNKSCCAKLSRTIGALEKALDYAERASEIEAKRHDELREENGQLRSALEEIERRGHHGGYHGRGYSLADVAKRALKDDN